ncbi:Esterase/lipase superfamily enzyme [Nonlabens sp. Hel1_33_55]|uniref:alpha/beta hydrolase n=1 Tax=Nonlabens sp. Hel1_33_55 TaxID=1336802 RepID=UPI000875E6CF|nr:alpha/beta hydrolase [Nonlabens sp. Hel1_33_55]SCX99412.1 Esterase/lipase superfamily enzyme [Nonlabens sp. Hel1_33_55]
MNFTSRSRTISCILMVLTSLAFGQVANKPNLLLDGIRIDTERECFDQDYPFDGLTVELSNDKSVKQCQLEIKTNNNQLIYQVESYRDFDGQALYRSMDNSGVFDRTGIIVFEFLITSKDNNTFIEYLEICINPNEPIVAESRGVSITSKKYTKVPIYYATDRKDSKKANVYERFAGELESDHTINYGICNVTIPAIHQIGQIESPSLFRFELSEDPEKHIVLQNIIPLSEGSFFNLMANGVSLSRKRKTFMFIHGYNVSFADAAKRTAQMKYDLKFDGEAVLYSWPSQAATSAYTIDENNIRWSTENIKNFLDDYITRSKAEEIYLIAHSMGNRGLTDALIDLIKEKPYLASKIKEIILAAPDIDAAIFKRDIAPQMVASIKKPITLYVSADDVALEASKTLHGRARAGDAEYGVMLVPGVETIDASGVDASFLSHSYFAETKSILDDLITVIGSGLRAKGRPKLLKISTSEGVYWKFKN